MGNHNLGSTCEVQLKSLNKSVCLHALGILHGHFEAVFGREARGVLSEVDGLEHGGEVADVVQAGHQAVALRVPHLGGLQGHGAPACKDAALRQRNVQSCKHAKDPTFAVGFRRLNRPQPDLDDRREKNEQSRATPATALKFAPPRPPSVTIELQEA